MPDWSDRFLEIQRLRVGDIAAHSRNPKRHPARQQDALRETLRTLGQADVLKAYYSERNGGRLTLYDGHARQGLDDDVTWPVAIFDLTDAEADDWLRYADPIASLAETDSTILDGLLADASTDSTLLAELLSERGAAAGLFDGAVEPGAGGDDDVSDVPEDGPTRVQPGDVWRVGDHLVACLDSTDRANVERVLGGRKVGMVWADPPYGIKAASSYADGTTHKGMVSPRGKHADIAGDDTTDTARRGSALLLGVHADAVHVWWGANHYADALPPSSCWIVWDKENPGVDFADGELAWLNQKLAIRIFRHQWMGIWKDSERGERRTHPTQKPIALCLWAFDKYGAAGDVILDPFLGSGPSLKAAHRLGDRTVVGFELSPHYCDHVVEWAEAQGLACERVEPTALPCSELGDHALSHSPKSPHG